MHMIFIYSARRVLKVFLGYSLNKSIIFAAYFTHLNCL